MGKLGHVGNNVIDPESIQRVRIGQNERPHHFRPHVAAPYVGITEKEALQIGYAVFTFGVEVQPLILQVRL